jgi:hypothetical protein
MLHIVLVPQRTSGRCKDMRETGRPRVVDRGAGWDDELEGGEGGAGGWRATARAYQKRKTQEWLDPPRPAIAAAG